MQLHIYHEREVAYCVHHCNCILKHIVYALHIRLFHKNALFGNAAEFLSFG